jgi:hypothetical protein
VLVREGRHLDVSFNAFQGSLSSLNNTLESVNLWNNCSCLFIKF